MMVGYGPETKYFALELTYNYGIDHYDKRDDMRYIAMRSNVKDVPFAPFRRDVQVKRAQELGYTVEETDDGGAVITGPDQYRYKLVDVEAEDPFVFVSLNVSNLDASNHYWRDTLGLEEVSGVPGAVGGDQSTMLSYGSNQTKLELVRTPGGAPVEHGSSYGRIAFATEVGPRPIYDQIKALDGAGGSILKDPITLSTPGKADVVVTILLDPDGYEICFVNKDGFYELCTPKPGDTFIDWESRASFGGDGHPVPVQDYSGVDFAAKGVGTLESDGDFDESVLRNHDAPLVVVDFMASWCKKCRKVAPAVTDLSDKLGRERGVRFFKADVDDLEETAAAQQVSGVPHFMFFRNGEKVGEYKGSTGTELENAISEVTA